MSQLSARISLKPSDDVRLGLNTSQRAQILRLFSLSQTTIRQGAGRCLA